MCLYFYIFLYLINLNNFSTNLPYDIHNSTLHFIQLFFLPPWNKNVPEIIKIDHVRFLIYLHQQPLDAKRYKTSIYQSNPKQPKANNDHYQRSLQGLHREHA